MTLDPLAIVTLGLAGGGAIAYVVELRGRVNSHEDWREIVNGKFDKIDTRFDRVERIIRGEER